MRFFMIKSPSGFSKAPFLPGKRKNNLLMQVPHFEMYCLNGKGKYPVSLTIPPITNAVNFHDTF